MRILVVDDEVIIRRAFERLFVAKGFVVETAENGHEALARLANGEPPTAIILDLDMPYVDGTAVYGYLQEERRLADVFTILVTGDPSRAPAGALVMVKPVSLPRLLAVIHGHIALRLGTTAAN